MAEMQEEILCHISEAEVVLAGIQSISGLSVKEALTFDFFKDHAIYLLGWKNGFDWNAHINKLFQPMESIPMPIMDTDVVNKLGTKGAPSWTPDIDCLAHQALLVTYSHNNSTIVCTLSTDTTDKRVVSALVVWVAYDQARISLPDAIRQLVMMANMEDWEGAVLCFIPTSKPYFPYHSDGPHILVAPYDATWITSQAYGPLLEFCAFEMTSYLQGTKIFVGLTSRLDKGGAVLVSQEANEEVWFNEAAPHSTMWNNCTFLETGPSGEEIVAEHEVYLGSHTMAYTTEALASMVSGTVSADEGPSNCPQNVPDLAPQVQNQVLHAFQDNPTMASHLWQAVANAQGGKSTLVTLPGDTDTLVVPVEEWLVSGQTLATTP